MSTMIIEIYDAFRKGGIPEQKSRDVARTTASFELDILELKGKTNLLQWMMGVNLAFSMAMFWKIFFR